MVSIKCYDEIGFVSQKTRNPPEQQLGRAAFNPRFPHINDVSVKCYDEIGFVSQKARNPAQ